MKAPISWLKEYLDLSLTPEELAKALTLAGVEVDSVDSVGAKFTGVVVGKVLSAVPHPHADRLRVAAVTDGTEEFQVVCGAPNCRAGISTAFAKVGSVLIDEEGKPFKIKKGKLREVESQGMLCSAVELGLGDAHDGIMELGEEFPIGSDFAGYHSDVVLDVSLTPNLGHCMSMYGMARDLSAVLNIPLKSQKLPVNEGSDPIEKEIEVHLLDKSQCQRYACRVIKGVQVGPSPQWLQKKIEQCGIRSINNVVDIGNLVMLQCGQPLHMFDWDKIEGKKLFIASGTSFSEMATLDDTVRAIPPESVMICDANKPLAFGGVMGGKSSAVSEESKNIVIEAAYFTPQAIRKTSKMLDLKSDSSHRFEKGIDPNGVTDALDLAAALLQSVAGGTIAKGKIDVKAHEFSEKKIACRPHRVNALLGTELSNREMAEILSRLQMRILEESENQLLVSVPTYRNDISFEVDLIEEIARIYGYNNIPRKPPRHVTTTLFDSPLYLMEKRARALLVSEGLQELLTCDLIHPDQAALSIESTLTQESLIPVLQAHSVDQSVLRASLLPGLLQVVKHNCAHSQFDIRGFEVGRVHLKSDGQFVEPSTAAIILTGKKAPYHWETKPQEVDFYDLKGIVENFFLRLGVSGIAFEISHLHHFHPGRQARIKKGDVYLGIMGEIHPDVIRTADISQRVYFAEISLSELLPLIPKHFKVSDIPQFPGSERDWTLSLPEQMPVETILNSVRSARSRLLEKVILLDLYKSEQIGKDRKNATFRFFYRDLEKTIAYETVEREHARVTQMVNEKIKGEL